jgi:Xaa-Pro aminopeptidase
VDHASRRARLAERLGDLGADAFLVTSLANVRYLTGYTGSNGQLLLCAGESRFFTDGRYVEQSRHEVPDLRRDIYPERFPEAFVAASAEMRVSRVAFEADAMSYQLHAELGRAGRAELRPSTGEVERLRWVKDAEEMVDLTTAQGIADDAFDQVTGKLAEGITEREVAFELEIAMHRAGADGVSFDTIVAFGENAAEPHHQPGERQLGRGDVVKLDFGALVAGYHSDMTRTVAFGEPPEVLREVYEVVRASQQAGIDAVRPGVRGSEPDEASREVIRAAGYGDAYKHSLGHGVGLEIHEGPSLRRGCTDELPVGAVVTVEPGVYLEGVGGVRIEDMVEVTAGGCRVIPRTTKELIVL